MERLDDTIKEIRRIYLETVQAILNTDLEDSVKILKVKVEYNLMEKKVADLAINYRIEKHYEELPF